MAFEAHGQGAQSAQREVDIVGSGGNAELAHRAADDLLVGGRTGDHAQHRVGVADHVFGTGLDRNVDAEIEGPEMNRRRPSRVHDERYVGSLGGRGDSGDVLHLEGQGAGRLGVDQARIRSDQRGDVGADAGVVVSRLHAEPAQHAVAEDAGRVVGGIGDEYMIARLDECQDRAGNRRQARGDTDAVGATLQFGDRRLQREGRRRPEAAIGGYAFGGVALLVGFDAFVEHGGGMEYRWIDGAEVGRWIAAEVRDESVAPVVPFFHPLRNPS